MIRQTVPYGRRGSWHGAAQVVPRSTARFESWMVGYNKAKSEIAPSIGDRKRKLKALERLKIQNEGLILDSETHLSKIGKGFGSVGKINWKKRVNALSKNFPSFKKKTIISRHIFNLKDGFTNVVLFEKSKVNLIKFSNLRKLYRLLGF